MSDKDLIVTEAPSGQLKDAPMVVELGDTYGIAPAQVIKVLQSIVKVPRNAPPATPAELIIVLSVMQQYKMNPMLKQIHAWRDNRGELAVMMGYDGWTQKANEQPGFLSVSYEYGPEAPSPDGKGRTSWEWVKATVHDSKRGKMVQFPVYLEEWYQPAGNYPGPWQKQTRHKMHVVTYRLAIREAYSISMDVRDPEDFSVAHSPAEATAGHLTEMTEGMKLVQPEINFIPCGSGGCGAEGMKMCHGCQSFFCEEHINPDTNTCYICELGD